MKVLASASLRELSAAARTGQSARTSLGELVDRPVHASDPQRYWRCELAVITVVLALFNLPLLTGTFSPDFVFHPIAVRAGEWWRVLTHPFVHVSLYHLVLDAAAFLIAYAELKHLRLGSRLALVLAGAAGSLLSAVTASPLVATHGLCGLSGVAHGLAAFVALETLRRSDGKLVRCGGLLCFVGVVGKGMWEAITGNIAFASWHLGSLGTPIAVCHAGGILGALCFWLLLRQKSTIGTGVLPLIHSDPGLAP